MNEADAVRADYMKHQGTYLSNPQWLLHRKGKRTYNSSGGNQIEPRGALTKSRTDSSISTVEVARLSDVEVIEFYLPDGDIECRTCHTEHPLVPGKKCCGARLLFDFAGGPASGRLAPDCVTLNLILVRSLSCSLEPPDCRRHTRLNFKENTKRYRRIYKVLGDEEKAMQREFRFDPKVQQVEAEADEAALGKEVEDTKMGVKTFVHDLIIGCMQRGSLESLTSTDFVTSGCEHGCTECPLFPTTFGEIHGSTSWTLNISR